MNRYSYRVLTTSISDISKAPFVENLDRLGAEGWKLVSSIPQERHGYSHEVHLLFMRREPER